MSKRTNLRVLLSLIGLAALGTCLIFGQGATAAISGIIAACRNFRQAARASFIGPRFWNLDTALHKRFSITEQVNMQFRAEAFNIFNHPNFALPNPLVFSGSSYNSSAGSITATSNASRQIQFAVKLLF